MECQKGPLLKSPNMNLSTIDFEKLSEALNNCLVGVNGNQPEAISCTTILRFLMDYGIPDEEIYNTAEALYTLNIGTKNYILRVFFTIVSSKEKSLEFIALIRNADAVLDAPLK